MCYVRSMGVALDLPRVTGIGVDDWAYRKRYTYGTVIVDLVTHQPLELLKNRDGKAFKTWLQKHSAITLVARDRAIAYLSAVDEVIPNVIQILYCFYINKNLLDALKLSLSSYLPSKIRLFDLQSVIENSGIGNLSIKTEYEQKNANRQEHKRKRIMEIRCYSVRTMAIALGISRNTIHRFREGKIELLVQLHSNMHSRLDPYSSGIIEWLYQGKNSLKSESYFSSI